MDHIQLKNASIKLPRMSLGTWAMSGAANWGPCDDALSIRTIHAALANGVNCFDTAERYGDGHGEELLGRAIDGRRTEAVICTKVYTTHLAGQDVITCCEQSLRRLHTDYIDIYQVHWPSRDIPLEETLAAMEQLKAQGKIRAIGLCNCAEGSLAASEGHAVATDQLPYSFLWRLIEDRPLFEICRGRGIGIMVYSPLAQGLLTGKFRCVEDVPLPRRNTRFYSSRWGQGRHHDSGFEDIIFPFLQRLDTLCSGQNVAMKDLAIAFLLRQDAVVSVLTGCRSPEQLEENVRSFETKIPPDLMEEAIRLSDPLKEQMGSDIDLWDDASLGRFF